ncbi:hypothetical protein J6590_092119 [Homalodisca vitripennis]|nr:hypothetical protein J6590_046190 [Homalodisca vitripennis]KAG8290022.1 hypothetical protein J6590_092119 [Homalodisca vitripennis]
MAERSKALRSGRSPHLWAEPPLINTPGYCPTHCPTLGGGLALLFLNPSCSDTQPPNLEPPFQCHGMVKCCIPEYLPLLACHLSNRDLSGFIQMPD